MADLEGTYGKSVDFVQINADKKLDAEQIWWAKQFKVSSVPNVALVSANGKEVKTELVSKFSSEILRADVKALSEGQELPYSMVDAFQGRKLELPK
mmetsp:Transcript_108559/g.231862  ORF Transcript_108559/g.231862 Transcript_108559/m.231862 type:complete len:96 (-) Transcript_108559:60-347(-)